MDASQIQSILNALRAGNPSADSERLANAIEELSLRLESLERAVENADRPIPLSPVRRHRQVIHHRGE